MMNVGPMGDGVCGLVIFGVRLSKNTLKFTLTHTKRANRKPNQYSGPKKAEVKTIDQ